MGIESHNLPTYQSRKAITAMCFLPPDGYPIARADGVYLFDDNDNRYLMCPVDRWR